MRRADQNRPTPRHPLERRMPKFNFLNLRKTLPQKEFAKLVDMVIKTADDFDEWEGQANKFLNGGKLPPKSADDIEKSITQTENIVLAASKKLAPKDPSAERMAEAVKGMQGLKIAHRQLVGTLISQFEGLDGSGSKEVSKAAKEVQTIGTKCKKEAQSTMSELIALVKKHHKEANGHILRHGGYVDSQRKNTEATEKLLGRKLKSSIDEKEFKAAQDTVKDLEALIDDLERAEKIIKKA
jgi:molecular chaperone GrpE (heat shock protein)